MWVVEARTFEAKAYPVVVHQFQGETREEAEGYFLAHLKSDKFLRDCIAKKQFAGFKCRTTVQTLFRPAAGERWRVVARALWGEAPARGKQLGARVLRAVRAFNGH